MKNRKELVEQIMNHSKEIGSDMSNLIFVLVFMNDKELKKFHSEYLSIKKKYKTLKEDKLESLHNLINYAFNVDCQNNTDTYSVFYSNNSQNISKDVNNNSISLEVFNNKYKINIDGTEGERI